LTALWSPIWTANPGTPLGVTTLFPSLSNTLATRSRTRLLQLKANLARFTLNAPAFAMRRVRTGVSAASGERIGCRDPKKDESRTPGVRRPHRPGAAEFIFRPPGFNDFDPHPTP
jgi:hypothetical protein